MPGSPATGEAALDPARPIVDPHHHLWDRVGDRYLLDEFRGDLASGHAVTATVYVECGSMYRAEPPDVLRPAGEAEFVGRMAEAGAGGHTDICAAMVGHIDLRRRGVVDHVAQVEQTASGGRLRGIRHSACWDEDPSFGSARTRAEPGLLVDAGFRAGFARLAPLGLSFDAWLYHPQLPELTDLALTFADTTIVLDHLGAPLGAGAYAGRRDEVFREWRASLRQLAKAPNVQVKLGGLGMPLCGFGFDQRSEPVPSAELAAAWRPYVETAIELFGAGRCMFESNFPVEKVSCSYAAVWNAFKRIAAGCSEDEKAALFSGTATRVYRIGLTG